MHFKAARLGGHFVSERAAKWAPMACGSEVTAREPKTTKRVAKSDFSKEAHNQTGG
jgi:hypothetical protein